MTSYQFTAAANGALRGTKPSLRSTYRQSYMGIALEGAGFGAVAGLLLSYYWTLTSGTPGVIVAALFALVFATVGSLWSTAAHLLGSPESENVQ